MQQFADFVLQLFDCFLAHFVEDLVVFVGLLVQDLEELLVVLQQFHLRILFLVHLLCAEEEVIEGLHLIICLLLALFALAFLAFIVMTTLKSLLTSLGAVDSRRVSTSLLHPRVRASTAIIRRLFNLRFIHYNLF